MEKILWTKIYEEDLGTRDEKGLYDYAYHYYTYWFTLPNNQEIRVRRYTDTLEHCSIYPELDDLDGKNAPEKSRTKDYIFGIINFLLTNEGVKTIDYFNKGYKPVDLNKVKNNLINLTFEELTSDE